MFTSTILPLNKFILALFNEVYLDCYYDLGFSCPHIREVLNFFKDSTEIIDLGSMIASIYISENDAKVKIKIKCRDFRYQTRWSIDNPKDRSHPRSDLLIEVDGQQLVYVYSVDNRQKTGNIWYEFSPNREKSYQYFSFTPRISIV